MLYEVIYNGKPTGDYLTASSTRLAFKALRELVKPETEYKFLDWNIRRV